MSSFPFFATCARGLEPILADELIALKASDVSTGRGGVHFQGDKALLYRANLELRTAIRVLWPIMHSQVASTDELYQAVQEIDWSRYLTPDHTLAVDCNVRDSHITHSQYAARRVKDAICDQFVEKGGTRPSVNVERPMVGLNLHVYQDEAVLSLDSSGDSLHKRGYRPIQTRAPLNEALAAALVLLTGYHGDVPFVDPMCGSDAVHRGRLDRSGPAARLTRRHFGFMGWMDYDVALWTSLRDQARRQVRSRPEQPIVGSDLHAGAVAMAGDSVGPRGSATSCPSPAGISRLPATRRTARHSADESSVWRTAWRRKRAASPLLGLGEMCGQHFRGWRVFIFSGNASLARHLGVPVRSGVPLFNGKIPCRLLELDL